jgi:hypothetical protein
MLEWAVRKANYPQQSMESDNISSQTMIRYLTFNRDIEGRACAEQLIEYIKDNKIKLDFSDIALSYQKLFRF